MLGAGAALLPFANAAWAANGAVSLGEPQPFSFERLIEEARALAAQPWAPPPQAPDWLGQLTLEQQRAIRVLPERAVQLGPTPFQLRPVHLGSFFREQVRIHLVQGGSASELRYDPAMFDLGGVQPPEPLPAETGFAGFRIFYPLGTSGSLDELLVFQGASYFRAVGRGTRYGISARGLALETGLGKPEEFPSFTQFWIVQPADQFDPLTICALLRSRSVTGAYRFVVVPRESTAMQVDASLFFRSDVEQVGIAPLTSMFYFGPNDRIGIDDYRGRVHNSGGLSMWRGGGEVLWRPLVDPATLRVSVFEDENPRGFGLLQRERDLADFGDLDARFDLRPNLWVEPKGAWGKGSVRVIEIPTGDEVHDNIVAFWTPAEPVRAGSELRLAYSLVFSLDPPLQTGLVPVINTAVGRGGRAGDPDRPPELRRVALDFAPLAGQGPGTPAPEVNLACANAECTQPILQPNPGTGGWRVLFDSRLGGGAVELRCFLTQGGRPVSETWLYRLDNN
jgi:glucans biosynthesis protein